MLEKKLQYGSPIIKEVINTPARLEFVENSETKRIEIFQIFFNYYGNVICMSASGISFRNDHGFREDLVKSTSWENLMEILC